MSYTLKLTNGKLLLTLPDQTSDSVSTSLTLIGKNVNAYGTDINQNYIRILENFANTTAPNAPLIGQLWYDTNSQNLKVFTKNNQFKTVGAPIISGIEPITLGIGEFWYDTVSEQMKFKADAENMITVGPQYNAKVGKAGWLNEVIYDTANNTQTVVNLYSNNILMGVLTDTSHAVRSDYTTSTGGLSDLKVGFNATNSNKWWGTADLASALADDITGLPLYSSQFLMDRPAYSIEIKNSPVGIYSSLYVGHMDGASGSPDLFFSNEDGYSSALIKAAGDTKNLKLKVSGNPGKGAAIFIHGTANRVGIFNESPLYDLDITGDVRVSGTLLVSGPLTYITSTELSIVDNNIELGKVDLPDDRTAEGGGITIRSLSRDKEIKWVTSASNFGFGVDKSWSITDNLELRDVDSAYYIYGQKVLDRTSLGPSVISAPNLTEIGALSSLNVGTISIFSSTGATSTTTIGGNPGFPSTTIAIGAANSNGTIVPASVTFKGATRVTTPYPNSTAGDFVNQVASVKFVQDQLTSYRNKTMSLSIDVTGYTDDEGPYDSQVDNFVIQMLTYLWDPGDPDPVWQAPNYARARVICVRYQSVSGVAYTDVVGPSDPGSVTPLEVDQDGIPRKVVAMPYQDYRFTVPLPARDLTIQRVVKEYEVYNGSWRATNGGKAGNIVTSTNTIEPSSDWYWLNPAVGT